MLCIGSQTATFQNRQWYVPKMWSVRDRTSLPSHIMLHFRSYCTHEVHSGREWPQMPSMPAYNISTVIVLPIWFHPGSSMFVFRYPPPIRLLHGGAAPWTRQRDKWTWRHPVPGITPLRTSTGTLSPARSCNLKMFGTWFCCASIAK